MPTPAGKKLPLPPTYYKLRWKDGFGNDHEAQDVGPNGWSLELISTIAKGRKVKREGGIDVRVLKVEVEGRKLPREVEVQTIR